LLFSLYSCVAKASLLDDHVFFFGRDRIGRGERRIRTRFNIEKVKKLMVTVGFCLTLDVPSEKLRTFLFLSPQYDAPSPLR
jgi:hypothetical protein